MLRSSRGWMVSVALCAALVAGCNDAADTGSFGEAKKTQDDGMVQKPAPVAEAAPDFATAATLVPTFDKATSTVSVVLQLKPGFHAYAVGEEIGKPVEMAIDDKNGWKLEGAVVMPAGQKKDLGTLGTSMILEGDVALKAVVKGGAGDVSGVVTAQVCTDKACDRPKQYTFAVPTT